MTIKAEIVPLGDDLKHNSSDHDCVRIEHRENGLLIDDAEIVINKRDSMALVDRINTPDKPAGEWRVVIRDSGGAMLMQGRVRRLWVTSVNQWEVKTLNQIANALNRDHNRKYPAEDVEAFMELWDTLQNGGTQVTHFGPCLDCKRQGETCIRCQIDAIIALLKGGA